MTATRTRPLWLVIAATAIPVFMATLDNLVVTNALPTIARDLDASLSQLTWIVNAYSLAFASLILMAVALGDRFGRRRIFVAGIAVFTVASALCALATDANVLIAARVLQGAGAAAMMPLSLALLAGAVPKRLRPLAIGISGAVAGLGVALGPLIGGAIVGGFTWHAIFWLNVPVGLVSLVLVYVALGEAFGRRVRPDFVGVALAGTAVFAIVFGIIRGNSAGWSSAQVLGGILGGVALLGAFLLWERKVTDPLIPLGLFRDRSFSAANGVSLLFTIGIFGTIFILVQFLQVVQGKTPLQAGVMTMPWTLAPLVVSPIAGILSGRIGPRPLIVTGTVFMAAGLAWIALVVAPDVAYGTLVPAFVLAGVGMGLVFAPSSTAILANMRDEDHATASGTNHTIREVGVALGISILAAVFTGAGGSLTPTGYTDAVIPAIWTGVAFLVAAALVGLALPKLRGVKSSGPDAVVRSSTQDQLVSA